MPGAHSLRQNPWRCTLRNSVAAAFILFLFLPALAVHAKDKERQWQTGKVLDTGRSSVYAGNVSSASGSATSSGDSTYGSANGSSVAVYRVYETYEIESEGYIYDCQEHIKWRWSKPAVLTVNGPVQFALEGNHIYIKSEDGSEHETKIVKKVVTPKQMTTPGSQTQTPPTNPVAAVSQGREFERGTVTVTSTPDGGDVYADASFVGNAPAVLKLPEGKHTIKVSMAGLKDWTREIAVLSGSQVRLTAALQK
jgi:hypothetical protein